MLTAEIQKQPTGVERNSKITQEGQSEMDTGKFSHGTKQREGIVPHEKEERRNEA